ncbi:MAG: hypothetical protein CYPHOPRED_006045 [Cyphobasidiales sp. Tagirdzhanova-0007]|nr:MAG: hypothetical protein CYPHOPRED_006045 [Cyphobasidiales sp. Tagirdzhanova-0007]
MVFSPKSVLITGATSEGIGLSLAKAIHDLPSAPKVIITGRRQGRLDEISAGKDRIYGKKLDQSAKQEDLKKWVADLLSEHPDLDMLIFNAGVQLITDYSKPDSLDISALESEVYTNYTSPMIMISAFIPHLLKLAAEGKTQPRLVTVTSGLAVIPKPDVGNYCATKAALHSLTMTLRCWLSAKGIKVIELAPPLVESQLHDDQGTTEKLSKVWMPIKDFTAEVMEGFKAEHDVIACGFAKDAYTAHEADKHSKIRLA